MVPRMQIKEKQRLEYEMLPREKITQGELFCNTNIQQQKPTFQRRCPKLIQQRYPELLQKTKKEISGKEYIKILGRRIWRKKR